MRKKNLCYRQVETCHILILSLLPITILLIQSMNVSLEIKRRINLANRCYYGLNRQLSSKDLYRTYKTNILQDVYPTIGPLLLRGMDTINY